MYNSKEEAERLNPYIIVSFPVYQGEPCGPAQIYESCSCKRTADNLRDRSGGGEVMTRKQAEKKIKEWNKKYY